MYYIKERNNPQFKEPYYIACGKLTAKEAKKKEESIYGFNIMLKYKTLKEYNEACNKLNIK